MSNADTQNARKTGQQRSDLHEARPLLQAIVLGIVLAAALVAAAVLANPEEMGAPPLPTQTEQGL